MLMFVVDGAFAAGPDTKWEEKSSAVSLTVFWEMSARNLKSSRCFRMPARA